MAKKRKTFTDEFKKDAVQWIPVIIVGNGVGDRPSQSSNPDTE